MNCKNKTKKHSLTLRVGFTDREWCWLVVSGKGMASFPLWAFHGRVRRQDHDPSLTQSNQSNRKKCYPLLFSLLSWCDNKTERMAQVNCFKSSLQHLKKQGVWIEGWKRTMFRERKRMFFSNSTHWACSSCMLDYQFMVWNVSSWKVSVWWIKLCRFDKC